MLVQTWALPLDSQCLYVQWVFTVGQDTLQVDICELYEHYFHYLWEDTGQFMGFNVRGRSWVREGLYGILWEDLERGVAVKEKSRELDQAALPGSQIQALSVSLF